MLVEKEVAVEVKNDIVLMDTARKENAPQAKVDSHCKEHARQQLRKQK